MKNVILLVAAWIVSSMMLIGQTTMQVQSPPSKFVLSGTSTLHDWKMNVTQISGKVDLFFSEKGLIERFKGVSLKIPVESLKSEKKLMNTKTYEALKQETHPYIVFESNVISVTSVAKDAINISVTGTLTLAGVSKKKTFTAQVKQLTDGRIKVIGNYSVLMTEFGVEPPKMFMGTLKTGDPVMIDFEVYFK